MSWPRRKFIRTSAVIAGVSSCSLNGLIGCTPVKYISGTMEGNAIVVDKNQWGDSQYVLVKNQQLSAPIFITRTADGYTALYLECTHKKCEVRPNPKTLKCPCHGSEFDHQGLVLNGPAEVALQSFEIREDENNLYIQ